MHLWKYLFLPSGIPGILLSVDISWTNNTRNLQSIAKQNAERQMEIFHSQVTVCLGRKPPPKVNWSQSFSCCFFFFSFLSFFFNVREVFYMISITVKRALRKMKCPAFLFSFFLVIIFISQTLSHCLCLTDNIRTLFGPLECGLQGFPHIISAILSRSVIGYHTWASLWGQQAEERIYENFKLESNWNEYFLGKIK